MMKSSERVRKANREGFTDISEFCEFCYICDMTTIHIDTNINDYCDEHDEEDEKIYYRRKNKECTE